MNTQSQNNEDVVAHVWPLVRAVIEPVLENHAPSARGSFEELDRWVFLACQRGHAAELNARILDLCDEITSRRVGRIRSLEDPAQVLAAANTLAISHARACANVTVLLRQLVRTLMLLVVC